MVITAKRFWNKVNKTDTCWLWQGRLEKGGYGRFDIDNSSIYAHRYAFGEVPKGLEIDHLCRVRHCVNPEHLEAVTHQENMNRSKRWEARDELLRSLGANI